MKLNAKSSVSIVIPVFNEAAVIQKQVQYLFRDAKKHNIAIAECLLVENGSHDSTWQILKTLAQQYPEIKLIQIKQASFGQALKAGILKAKFPIIAVFNVDLINCKFLKKAIPLLTVVDIVVASKTLSASSDNRSLFRKLSTYFFNAVLRLILNYPGTDTHGIKVFRNTPFLKHTLRHCRTQNELLDTELIVRMTRHKALLVELPITVRELRPTRYNLYRRITSTLSDLVTAMRSKYFSSSFSPRVTVADDYGISSSVNSAIIEAVLQKKVHIVSVLAAYVSKSDVKKLQAVLPKTKWSLHFNLIRGMPISNSQVIPSLVMPNGYFYPLWLFLIRLLFKRIHVGEVMIELSAQYQALRKFGITPRYIDSEQHTHTFDPIAEVVSQFAASKKLTIRSHSSTRHYLIHKPFRYVVLRSMQSILSFVYRPQKPLTRCYHALISHPGTNYD